MNEERKTTQAAGVPTLAASLIDTATRIEELHHTAEQLQVLCHRMGIDGLRTTPATTKPPPVDDLHALATHNHERLEETVEFVANLVQQLEARLG